MLSSGGPIESTAFDHNGPVTRPGRSYSRVGVWPRTRDRGHPRQCPLAV